jgi:hypothetical protein
MQKIIRNNSGSRRVILEEFQPFSGRIKVAKCFKKNGINTSCNDSMDGRLEESGTRMNNLME